MVCFRIDQLLGKKIKKEILIILRGFKKEKVSSAIVLVSIEPTPKSPLNLDIKSL